MNSEELRQYIGKSKEGDYLIVDVRQPKEYVRGHIPGAKLIPIKKLVKDFSVLPSDKDLIFYCHIGGRSEVAATLVTAELVGNKEAQNVFLSIAEAEKRHMKRLIDTLDQCDETDERKQ